MNKSIFRKVSLERINSPEQLDDYIRVASPSVFLVMATVVLLLVGICVWGVFGQLNTTISVCAVGGADGLRCYVPEAEINNLPDDAAVNIGGESFAITAIAERPAPAGQLMSDYALHVGGLWADQWVYEASLDGHMGEEEDVFAAQIVLESVSPVSFVFN